MDRKNIKEVWRKIPGYKFHQASNLGRLRSIDAIISRKSKLGKYHTFKIKGKILSEKKSLNNAGYVFRNLKGGHKTEADHRIIWMSFNGKIKKGMVINHKNGIKTDNRLSNLECVTHRENIIHSMKSGLTKRANSGRMLYSDEDIRAIRFFYKKSKGVGSTTSILGKIFDCDRHSIVAIARNKTYSWVK